VKVQIAVLLLALGTVVAAPPSAALAMGMAFVSTSAVAAAESTGPALASALSQTQATGAEDPPLRRESMRDYWHVFIAFGCTWLLILGYLISVGRRFGQLEEEVRRLRGSS
jgi:CcmD family protein